MFSRLELHASFTGTTSVLLNKFDHTVCDITMSYVHTGCGQSKANINKVQKIHC